MTPLLLVLVTVVTAVTESAVVNSTSQDSSAVNNTIDLSEPTSLTETTVSEDVNGFCSTRILFHTESHPHFTRKFTGAEYDLQKRKSTVTSYEDTTNTFKVDDVEYKKEKYHTLSLLQSPCHNAWAVLAICRVASFRVKENPFTSVGHIRKRAILSTTFHVDGHNTLLVDNTMSTETTSTTTAEEEEYGGRNMSLSAVEDMDEETITRFCSSGSCFGWDKYYRLADMNGYLEYLQKKYPDLMTVETIGLTAEERPINLVKIRSSTNNTKTNAVWLDGGAHRVHAREWITSAAAMYILHEILISLEAENSTFSGLDYYIVPMMNPDGYEYSHTTDRLWRKNRSPNNGSSCLGTDLNRNWGFKWGGRESTSDPCSSNYRGKYAFSESESAAVSKYILKKRTQIKAYLSLHSYGQSILFPWAYTSVRTSDFKDLYDLAYYMARKVRANGGENYRFGTVSSTFYIASGGSQDWIKAEAGVKYSYTMELRDNGRHAFDLPLDQILATSQDAFAAFTVLSQKVKTGKYFI